MTEQLPSGTAMDGTPIDLHQLQQRFSDSTIEIVGEEQATELLRQRALLDASVVDADERDKRADTTEPSPIAELLTNKHALEIGNKVIDLHRAYGLFHEFEISTTTMKSLPATPLYDFYNRYKNEFPSIGSQLLDETLAKEEEYSHYLAEMKATTEEQFAAYRRANARESDVILRDISMSLGCMRVPSLTPDQLGNLTLYLRAEAAFSTFEHLEKIVKPEESNKLLELFCTRNYTDQIFNTKEPPYIFIPVRKLGEAWNTFQALEHHNQPLMRALSEYLGEYRELMKAASMRHLNIFVHTGSAAIKAAESAVLGDEVTHDAPDEYPYNSPASDEEQADTRYQAIKFLERHAPVSLARKEVTAVVTDIEEDDMLRMKLTAIWAAISKQQDWEQQIEQARHTVSEMVTNDLDNLLVSVKPLAGIVAGQKPRGPKTKKAAPPTSPSPEALASEVYDRLHREGDFLPHEKALLAHIAAGTWENIRQQADTVRAEYDTISTFAHTHGLVNTVTAHRMNAIMEFSSDTTLQDVRERLTALRQTLAKSLTHEQHSRLFNALEVLEAPQE